VHTSTRTLLRRRQEQLAGKSTLSFTKKSVPELNDQPSYILPATTPSRLFFLSFFLSVFLSFFLLLLLLSFLSFSLSLSLLHGHEALSKNIIHG